MVVPKCVPWLACDTINPDMFPQKRYHGAEFGREQSRTVAAKTSRAEVLPTDHDSPAVNRLLARSALHVGHRARRNRTGVEPNRLRVTMSCKSLRVVHFHFYL